MTKTPRAHAELIKAWADGEQIQFRNPKAGKETYTAKALEPMDWLDIQSPTWDKKILYRIKPEPTPDVFRFYSLNRYGVKFGPDGHNIVARFDGKTGKLKTVELVNES